MKISAILFRLKKIFSKICCTLHFQVSFVKSDFYFSSLIGSTASAALSSPRTKLEPYKGIPDIYVELNWFKVSWYKNSKTNFLWILSWQNYHLFYLLSNLVCCAQLLFILRYVFFEFFYNKNDLLNKWKQLDSKELTECQDHRALV